MTDALSRRRLLVPLACALSGLAALVYQVLWSRQLALVLGTTVSAVATVAATFMAGLGLGSALAARFVDRYPRARLSRLYAGLEAGILLLALALPLLLQAATPALAALYRSESMATLAAARIAIAGVVLLLPTTLMGATLPVLTALFAAGGAERAGRAAGLLYAANTLGAVAGCLAAPFVLLPIFGVRRSTWLAASLNAVAAALVLAAGAPAAVTAEARAARKEKPKSAPAPEAIAAAPVLVLAVIGLSGLGALLHEVAWTRALTLLIGPSSYAFAFILAAVIAGIALGCAAIAPWADRIRRPIHVLAAVEIALALVSFAVTRVIGLLPVPVGELVRDNADRMGRLMGLELAGVFVLLLLPSALFGAAFPLAVTSLSAAGGPAAAVGRVYAWNTAGAIAGALLAGFLALPAIGTERTLYLAGAAHAVAGSVALAGAAPRAAIRILVAAAIAAIAVWPLAGRPRWDPELISGGPYKYAAYVEAGAVRETLLRGELLYYREGATATVAVKRVGGSLSLSVDGKVDATSSADMFTQRMLAHVPLLLHPSPRAVAVVGLGSGVTAGSALTHGVATVDAVEISPEVVEAAALFRRVNRDVFADRRLRLVVADGRNHLLLTDRRYDVIISEPSNPWMAGVSALFTREFFSMARSRLAPGGLFCQWAHVYNMDPPDLRTVVGTFTDAFPHAALFVITEADILLVGSADPLPRPDPAGLARRMSAEDVRTDLAEVHLDGPFGFAALHALETPPLAEWARGAPRHTDDRPILELKAARSLHAETTQANDQALWDLAARTEPAEPWAGLRAHPTADQLVERARALEQAQSTSWALATFRQALDVDPRHAQAYEGLARAAVLAHRVDETERELTSLAGKAPVESRIGLALLLHTVGRPADALVQLEAAAAHGRMTPRGFLLAGDIQEEAGNLPAADGFARATLKLDPGNVDAQGLLAAVQLRAERLDEAAATADAVLARDPRASRALEVVAIVRARRGDRAAAQQAFETLLEVEPDVWGHCNNYGVFQMEGKDYRAAARLFERAVDIHPGDIHGWRGLLQAAQALGDDALLRRAQAALERLETGGG